MPREPNFGLALREVLGKRPAVAYLAPSKGLPWWIGTWAEGHRFSVAQERELIALGRDPIAAEAVEVNREACTRTEMAVPLNTWIPVYRFECPLLARRADGKLKVIAPDGSVRHIRGDGWATKPSSKPYAGAWGF